MKERDTIDDHLNNFPRPEKNTGSSKQETPFQYLTSICYDERDEIPTPQDHNRYGDFKYIGKQDLGEDIPVIHMFNCELDGCGNYGSTIGYNGITDHVKQYHQKKI